MWKKTGQIKEKNITQRCDVSLGYICIVKTGIIQGMR